MKLTTIQGLALHASLSAAQMVTYSPGDDSSISYAVSVPSASASSGSGDLFIQIKGPISGSNARSWIAIGQGAAMPGANMFIAYPNKSGNNVTLSPRLGTGYQQPSYNPDAKVELLSGTGIENGIMTANIKCSSCNSWSGGSMSFKDSSSSWIWSSGGYGPINSDDVRQQLSKHNEASSFQLDLTKATGSSSANPFASASSSSTTSTGSSGSSGSSSSSNGESSSSSSSSGSSDKLAKIITAHAAVMSLAFLFFFPLGAIIMRVGIGRSTTWTHAGLQMSAFILAIVGMGLGIWQALKLDYLSSNHAIIGLVTVSLLALQAPLGMLHHAFYKKHGGRTHVSFVHIWLGRSLLVLGTINGGLGLQLAGAVDEHPSGVIAYAVLAGIIYVAYFGVIALTFGKGKKNASRNGMMRDSKNERMSGGS